jgi:hypothetical protein
MQVKVAHLALDLNLGLLEDLGVRLVDQVVLEHQLKEVLVYQGVLQVLAGLQEV